MVSLPALVMKVRDPPPVTGVTHLRQEGAASNSMGSPAAPSLPQRAAPAAAGAWSPRRTTPPRAGGVRNPRPTCDHDAVRRHVSAGWIQHLHPPRLRRTLPPPAANGARTLLSDRAHHGRDRTGIHSADAIVRGRENTPSHTDTVGPPLVTPVIAQRRPLRPIDDAWPAPEVQSPQSRLCPSDGPCGTTVRPRLAPVLPTIHEPPSRSFGAVLRASAPPFVPTGAGQVRGGAIPSVHPTGG